LTSSLALTEECAVLQQIWSSFWPGVAEIWPPHGKSALISKRKTLADEPKFFEVTDH
jgi:hypothetical protein